jgi:hypothetical protein
VEPNEKKSHFDIGHAFEALLMQPEEYYERVEIFDEGRRPKPEQTFSQKDNAAWKESFFQVNAEKWILTPAEDRICRKMVKIVMADERFAVLLSKGDFQISVFWTLKNGLKVKARPDVVIFLPDNRVIIIDIKTTTDATITEFTKQAEKLDYAFQAIMQIIAMEALNYTVIRYYWLAVDKDDQIPKANLIRFTTAHQNIFRDVFDRVTKDVKHVLETGEYNYESKADRDKEGFANAPFSTFYLNKIRYV